MNVRADPNDPDAVKDEIEQTRQRMSGTLDEIEERLVRKKEEIREKLDVGARIREKPLQAAAIVLGAGLLLGLLSGGDGKAARSARSRGAKWESRARRLLDIARAQERQIDELQDLFEDPDPDLIDETEWWDEDDDEPVGYALLSDDDLDDDPLAYDGFDDDDIDEIYPDLDDPDPDFASYGSRIRKPGFRERMLEMGANAAEAILDSFQSRRP